MPKAILVTKENKNQLLSQYDLEDDQLDGYEGLYLVAEFGSDIVMRPTGYLSQAALDKTFVRTGVQLQNGYFEVARKN